MNHASTVQAVEGQSALVARKEKARQSVLVIDDEKINIKVLKEVLQDDAEILFSLDPHEGLQKAETLQPDVVLLDVMMPGLDGYSVCKLLKENPRTQTIPIIFVTGLNDPDSEEYGLSIGAIDFIVKPFRPAVVQARVRNQLSLRLAQQLLEEYALFDSLTGIRNRRSTLEVATAEEARAKREGTPFSVILFDLDHFKSINDTYGHDGGDAVLRGVTQTVSGVIRTTDIFGRLGGEEFALILPNTSGQDALHLCEKVRCAIDQAVIDHGDHALHVTASFGVCDVNASAGVSLDEAMKRADNASYKAKSLGRNQVQLAQDE